MLDILRVAPDGAEIFAGETVALAISWLVDASPGRDPVANEPDLDFAILRLAHPIGAERLGANINSPTRGFVRLAEYPVDAKPRMIAILQHPGGRPMQLALGPAQQLTYNERGTRLRHTVPTEQGSSGSPVFDYQWHVLAVHRSFGPNANQPEYNEAVPISAILSRPTVRAALGRA